MGLKSTIIKPIAKFLARKEYAKHNKAVEIQLKTLIKLIDTAKNTTFGNDFNFECIVNYDDFKAKVPVKDYEALKSYFNEIIDGKPNICWPSKPLYFAKTSGTTSGAKYIPISKESINHHIVAARNALLMYIAETGKASFFDKKMIFLQGSPVLTNTNEVATGRLSGIVYHHVPAWLTANRMPTYQTNCIEDWETKVDAIVEETLHESMSLISGIPPWCIMYFERLLQQSGKKTIQEIFPHFELFVYGGVNYAPYKEKIERLIGFSIPTIETFPASEGFFAYQDSQKNSGLLLNIDAGIFYEFVKSADFSNKNAQRICLADVELNVDYVLIVSTNAGLWAYNTGDTVRFVSLQPYRIVVSGRIKHFISAFGEHVIQEEVEQAISLAAKITGLEVVEFTVAPSIAKTENEVSCHEWLVEFKENYSSQKTEFFIQTIDKHLQKLNIYYKDLRLGNVLSMPKLTIVPSGSFMKYQVLKGKLGGQNKVQHLSNDRILADELLQQF
jgi:phenylacetate-coenzyme A ligase PaaK-like adenylate-forming protein